MYIKFISLTMFVLIEFKGLIIFFVYNLIRYFLLSVFSCNLQSIALTLHVCVTQTCHYVDNCISTTSSTREEIVATDLYVQSIPFT